MAIAFRVLVVSDRPDADSLIQELRRGGYEPVFERVDNREAMEHALFSAQWDLILASDGESAKFARGVLEDRGLTIPLLAVSRNGKGEAIVRGTRPASRASRRGKASSKLCPAVQREIRRAGRHRAENEREERLRALVNNSPMIIFALDHQGVVTRSEGKGLKRLGLKPGEANGRPVWQMYASYPEVLAVIRDALGGKALTGTATIGDVMFEVQLAPNFDARGRQIGVIGIATDVTRQLRAEQALRESESRKAAILGSALDAVISMDHEGNIIEFNPSAERIFGYLSSQAIGRSLCDLIIPHRLRAQHRAGVARYLLAKEGPILGKRIEMPALRADGTEFPAELTVIPIASEGQPLFTGFVRDITDRKRAEETRLQLASIVESSDDAILGKALDGTILAWNKGAERIYGYTAREAIGRPISILVPPERAAEPARILEQISQGQSVEHYETVRLRKDGTEIHVSLTISPVKDAAGGITGASAIARDITERKRAEERVKHLAFHDTLTDLPNRLLFNDRLTVAVLQAHRSQQQLATIFLDLDRFKNINDSLGHSVGDELLRRVARRVRGCVREGDTVARLGGDEFIVLAPGIASQVDAVGIAQKILEALRPPFSIEGHDLFVTASIGVALGPSSALDADALIRNADRAMYRAKEQGRDNYQLFTSDMIPKTPERLTLEGGLHRALQNGELVVHYQPLIELETGRVRGAEALIRWQHRTLGLLLPGSFISIAEASGLIVPIGQWTLKTACAQARAWQKEENSDLRIAVNLSSRELQQSDLVPKVKEALRQAELEPRCLELEVTESNAMRDAELVIRTLRELKSLGVSVSLDDFGTGYSSLSHLKHLPIDRLKIDQPFVRDIAHDPADAAIATTVIAMAHSLRLSVVAEGVETEPQLSFLRERRCDEIQGYLVSPALSVENFQSFLATRRATPLPPAREVRVESH